MPIEHIFVLMLENRSLDHMLGFSGITGTDADSGQPTQLHGLNGDESNEYDGTTYPVTRGADYVMPVDPADGSPGVRAQRGGVHLRRVLGTRDPPIDGSGFAANYAKNHGREPG